MLHCFLDSRHALQNSIALWLSKGDGSKSWRDDRRRPFPSSPSAVRVLGRQDSHPQTTDSANMLCPLYHPLSHVFHWMEKVLHKTLREIKMSSLKAQVWPINDLLMFPTLNIHHFDRSEMMGTHRPLLRQALVLRNMPFKTGSVHFT